MTKNLTLGKNYPTYSSFGYFILTSKPETVESQSKTRKTQILA